MLCVLTDAFQLRKRWRYVDSDAERQRVLNFTRNWQPYAGKTTAGAFSSVLSAAS